MNARIALAGDDRREARKLVERGLAAIDGVEAPVAAWQLHATAAEISQALGERGSAQSHWDLSRNIVLMLAASLEPDEVSRRTFLTSPAVAKVLDSAGVATPARVRSTPRKPAVNPPTVV